MAACIDTDISTERLEAEVCTLAAQIAAATYRFLTLIAELDRREVWKEWGCRSMAYWLSWKCALGMNAARDHVRVARALETLPKISAAFEEGRLSYSKVRAITRTATPEREHELLEFAEVATAAQCEQTIGAFERCRSDAPTERDRLDKRYVRMFDEPDGTVIATERMTREVAELFSLALERALKEVPFDAENNSAELRRADAFELILRSFLAGKSDRVTTEVVIHADVEDLAEAPPVLLRDLCDTSLRVGDQKRTRTIPRALRRKLARRDKGGCRWRGCPCRQFLHVHHLVHYVDGGATSMENCIQLCPFHHRLVHEGGWMIEGNANEVLTFVSPRGKRFSDAPEPALPTRFEPPPGMTPETIATAFGEPLDLDLAVTWLVSTYLPERN